MYRLIKRYESRKLYDTEESRYVSLDELAEWIRTGKDVKVVDNGTGADVTAQMLTQIILEEGRRGTGFLPSELLHELVRAGQKAVESGVEQVQHKVDQFFQASIDKFGPVRQAREEMERLRERLEARGSLTKLEKERGGAKAASAAPHAPRAGQERSARKPNAVRPLRRGKGEAK
jgi:polyhydroxyalkanoate synthesis repressor PhaR